MAALRQDELRRLATRFDSELAGLERRYLRELLGELRVARAAIHERLLQAEIPAYETWRLTALEADIDRVIAAAQWRVVRAVQDHVARSAAAGDRYAAAALGLGATVAGSFGVVNVGALAHLVSYQYGLIRGITDQVKSEIKRQLLQGVLQGESIPKIAQRLVKGTALERGVWSTVETRAEVIARTETMRAYTQAARWQYQRYGVKRVVWLTGRDERVCEWCAPLDGQLFPVDGLPGGGPPLHPRCRCMVAPDIAESEDEARARDDEAATNLKQAQSRLKPKKGARK